MRYSLFLIAAATLIVVQAAPVTVESKASAEPLAPSRCWKVDGEWECSGGDGPDPRSEPRASAEPLAPSRCWKVDVTFKMRFSALLLAAAAIVAIQAAPVTVEPEAAGNGPCRTYPDGSVYCAGVGSVEPKAAGVNAGNSPCRTYPDGSVYCAGVGSIEPKAKNVGNVEPKAAGINAGNGPCRTYPDGSVYCAGVGSVEPKAENVGKVEPKAAGINAGNGPCRTYPDGSVYCAGVGSVEPKGAHQCRKVGKEVICDGQK
ncbi:hypothetical protein BGX24_000538 [Mortierella sp. AD032]|nr:hypothetical protein BGX24_000538 [Mortierella sp. AD032]